ncbi:Ubiquitin thioesterase Zranb1-like protein, partial [Leptotrombidium deliense]
RNELLALLLANSSPPVAKRVPSDVSRESSSEVRRHFSNCLRQRKGDFPCFFVSEAVTFSLPAEIEDLAPSIQERLFDELLDRDVQKELEEESPIINWSLELTETFGSRLYALWNRSTGDCLLDSALQATWGIFDKDNVLRKALADSLSEASQVLFPRFKEAETLHPNLLHFTLDEDQWEEDWAVILSLATQPGSALEQFHIFTLAHILRRPIIVYGVKYVKSFRGETLGYAGFEGVYLPLLWEPSFCWKSPVALGYTRGHFSALIPVERESIDARIGASAPTLKNNDDSDVCYLPLITSEHKLLPFHFLSRNELGREDEIMRQWLDCCVIEGIPVAKQKFGKRPLSVAQMLEDWLNFYRNIKATPTTLSHNSAAHDYSSDGDSD